MRESRAFNIKSAPWGVIGDQTAIRGRRATRYPQHTHKISTAHQARDSERYEHLAAHKSTGGAAIDDLHYLSDARGSPGRRKTCRPSPRHRFGLRRRAGTFGKLLPTALNVVVMTSPATADSFRPRAAPPAIRRSAAGTGSPSYSENTDRAIRGSADADAMLRCSPAIPGRKPYWRTTSIVRWDKARNPASLAR